MAIGPKILIREDWTFFLQWFLTTIDRTEDDFVLQKEEVERVKWFTSHEIREMIQQSPESFVPSMKSWPKEFLS
jgi:isopentenyldiphosphate isomerase